VPLPLLAVGAIAARIGMTAATLAPLVKPAIGIVKRLTKQTARPGIGSKVTKGPLVVGRTTLYGRKTPGVGRVLGAAGAAGGIGVVASHRSTKPSTQSRPQAARPTPNAPTKTEKKKCCPLGTKRMVCFKRGRVKPRKKAAKKAKPRKKAPRKAKARKRSTRKRRT